MSNFLGVCTIDEMKKFYFLLDRMRKILEEYGVKISYKTLENLSTGISCKPTYTVVLDDISFLKNDMKFTKKNDKSEVSHNNKTISEEKLNEIWDKMLDNEKVSHPKHYCEGRKYEPKDVISDWGLNFNTGSAVKYLSRAGRKGNIIEDLEKAKQFIQFEIDYLRKEKNEIEFIDLPPGAEVTVSFLDNEEYEKWKQERLKKENYEESVKNDGND